MIASRAAPLDQLQGPASVCGCGFEDAAKLLWGHTPRAAGRHQQAVWGQQAHGPQVEFFVGPQGGVIRGGRCGGRAASPLGQGRGIDHHDIEARALALALAQKIKGIGPSQIQRDAVEAGVVLGASDGLGVLVTGGDRQPRARQCRAKPP